MSEVQVHVRAAELPDAEVIAAFNLAMARETEDLGLDAERLLAGVRAVFAEPARGFYRIAEIDGEPAGCLMVTTEWSDWRNGTWWWIQSVFVAPEFRRRGVYRALYRAVLEEAEASRSQRIVGVRLYVDADNRRAQGVYEALGMSPSHYRMYEVELDR